MGYCLLIFLGLVLIVVLMWPKGRSGVARTASGIYNAVVDRTVRKNANKEKILALLGQNKYMNRFIEFFNGRNINRISKAQLALIKNVLGAGSLLGLLGLSVATSNRVIEVLAFVLTIFFIIFLLGNGYYNRRKMGMAKKGDHIGTIFLVLVFIFFLSIFYYLAFWE
ncbi:MAG: hypothetical protein Q8P37_00085 [Candidatus Spechtbacteria bacterium]|nr:hypothetical protein [Candidatus Spechtbacteria bacterium]